MRASAVGMADGYAQASGRPALVNLHTAPGRRQRDGRDLQRAGQQVPAGDHRGPAGALADDAAGAAHQPRRRADAAPARQVELRAAAGRGRPARARARDPPRRPAAAGPGVRLDPDGRLARGGRRRCRPPPDDAHGRGRALADPALVRALAQRLWRPPTPSSSPAGTSTRAAAGTPRSRWPRRRGCRSGRRRPPAAAGSASRRTTRTSRACSRPRRPARRRRSPATT